MNRLAPILLALALVGAGLLGIAHATDTDKRLFDRSKLELSMGVATITTTAADFTAWQPLITIAPDPQHAIQDLRVAIDLDKATTGFADAYTSETISFAIARKVDGTNWRTATNTATTAVAADDSDGFSRELFVGTVGPDDDVRIMVKLSAEANANFVLPYLVHYRSGVRATITPAQ